MVTTSVPLVKVAEYRMREARRSSAAVAHGDYIYIIGGTDNGLVPLDSVERLNLRTGVSEDFARLGVARSGHRAVVVGDTIYVLGGAAAGVATESALPSASLDRRTVKDTRTQLDALTATTQSSRLEDSVELIDLKTRKVSNGITLPRPRRHFACVLLGEKIYVIGGHTPWGTTTAWVNTMDVFDLKTRRWLPGEPMPGARAAPATLIDGPFIIVPGGYNGRGKLDAVNYFNTRDTTWRTLPPLCRPTSAASLAFLGHHLFLFGDFDAPDELLAYDLVSKHSETFTLQYKPARSTTAVVHKGKIYVIGGEIAPYPTALDLIQVFALRKKG
jgi:hypothetical protein